MSTNLYDAAKQWAERPADERYWTVREMHDRCRGYFQQARDAVVPMDRVTIGTDETQNLTIAGPAGNPATLTHWSFGQLAGRAAAPAEYLRTLPAPLAAQCLQTGLTSRGVRGDECNVLFHQNGHLVCRAFTSDKYSRIWNWQVCEQLLGLDGWWRVPPARPAAVPGLHTRPATEADVLERSGKPGLAVKVGDPIAPAGLYASDHDMFAFMVDETCNIADGSDGGLSRGFFVTNSEVGAAALKITRFLYRHVCGNHIVWDVKDVQELRIVHTGRNSYRFASQLRYELHKYRQEGTQREEGFIHAAKRHLLGQKSEEVIDVLFKAKVAPRKILEAAWPHAVQESDLRTNVDPRSSWGFAQGLTHLSQETQWSDRRLEIDRAAGKVLSIAF